jgi:hypothetical protein
MMTTLPPSQGLKFQGIYQLKGLKTFTKGNPTPTLSTTKIPFPYEETTLREFREKLEGTGKPTKKQQIKREMTCLEDFISNRPRSPFGKTVLFWVNKLPYAVTNDAAGNDFTLYQRAMKTIQKEWDKKLSNIQNTMLGSTPKSVQETGINPALLLIQTLTESEKAKHPYHLELATKATPATVEITRGGKDGFIKGYQFKPLS